MIKGSLLMSLPIIKRFWHCVSAVSRDLGVRGQEKHILHPIPRIAYSLYNFQGAAVMIKGIVY